MPKQRTAFQQIREETDREQARREGRWFVAFRAVQEEACQLSTEKRRLKEKIALLEKELDEVYSLNNDLMKLVEEQSVVVDIEAAEAYIAKHAAKVTH